MYTPKMMATVHAMGSRKKAEGGVSLSGAPIRRDRGYTGRSIRSQYLGLRGSIFRVRSKKDTRSFQRYRRNFDNSRSLRGDTIKIGITTEFLLSLT